LKQQISAVVLVKFLPLGNSLTLDRAPQKIKDFNFSRTLRRCQFYRAFSFAVSFRALRKSSHSHEFLEFFSASLLYEILSSQVIYEESFFNVIRKVDYDKSKNGNKESFVVQT
jgi:hypothetical protein